jgi:hypothetical protein
MGVCYDTFLQWAIDRFGEENIKFKKGGSEICTHSFFAAQKGLDPDQGFHLWMNPSGGKRELEHGAYRCWKTDTMGSLVSLVSELDSIPFDEAEELLCGSLSLRSLELKVEAFFRNNGNLPAEEPPVANTQIRLPDYAFQINKLPKNHFFRIAAEKYLTARKLPIDKYYVCTDGSYANRIVIPYYDRDGQLIWFNARTLSKKTEILRYKKPEGEGLSQNNVLYFPQWPPAGEKVYLTEGEFDADVLFLAGLYSCACGGKYLSPTQLQMLRDYDIVMAFDNDSESRVDAGKEATMDIGNILLIEGFVPHYIRPPKGYKDWNKLLEKTDLATVKKYIERYEKPYTRDTANMLKFQEI